MEGFGRVIACLVGEDGQGNIVFAAHSWVNGGGSITYVARHMEYVEARFRRKICVFYVV